MVTLWQEMSPQSLSPDKHHCHPEGRNRDWRDINMQVLITLEALVLYFAIIKYLGMLILWFNGFVLMCSLAILLCVCRVMDGCLLVAVMVIRFNRLKHQPDVIEQDLGSTTMSGSVEMGLRSVITPVNTALSLHIRMMICSWCITQHYTVNLKIVHHWWAKISKYFKPV